MNRLRFSLALLFAFATSIISFAHDFEVDGIYYNINDDGTSVSVTYEGSSYDSYSNEYSGDVVIPSEVTYNGKTYSVTDIGYGALFHCTELTSVTIPNSVTYIGDNAFSGCSGLTSIIIPNFVISIGSDAFHGCDGLTSITIPNSVTTIGYAAFYGCSGLTSIIIPNSVTSIGSYAFSSCSGLISVTIPNSVTHIGKGTFGGCIELSKIVVSEGNSTFDSRNNCNAIIETSTNVLIVGCKNTIIPNSVTSIDQRAFYGCTGLTSITIPNSVTTIGEYAFYGCSGLTSITIPNSVTSIVDNAFSYCSGLSSITIPNSVTSISKMAFYNCKGLTSVMIPNSVTSIGDYAFYNCKGLTSFQCDTEIPPTLGTDVFKNVDKTSCTLIVPDASLAAYKAADQWNDFLNLTGVEEIAIEESNISIENGKIINSNNENIEVYNLSGVKVYSGNKAEVELNSGVYIVVIGNKAVKIAL